MKLQQFKFIFFNPYVIKFQLLFCVKFRRVKFNGAELKW